MRKLCHRGPQRTRRLFLLVAFALAAWTTPARGQHPPQPNPPSSPSARHPQPDRHSPPDRHSQTSAPPADSPTATNPAATNPAATNPAATNPAVVTPAATVDAESARLISGRFPALSPAARATPPHDDPQTAEAGSSKTNALAAPGFTVASSLAVVLGLFAGFVWLTRRFSSSGGSHGVIPKEVLQNLGSTSIDSRTKVSMIRCGNRIIVVAQTATGIHPLSEITDPNEVQQLTASCLGDAKRNFANTLREFENEPAEQGFVGATSAPSASPHSRGRLFTSVS